MSKQKRRGRATFKGFDFATFVSKVLADVSEYLEDEELIALYRALNNSPQEFRSLVKDFLAEAETSLAEGRGDRYVLFRQIDALLKKNPDWHAKDPEERRKAAFTKFSKAELWCRLANKRISWYRKHWSRQPFVAEVINLATQYSQEILGVLDQDVIEEIFDNARFGNGATFLHSSGEGSLYHKLYSKHTITEEAKPLLAEYLASSDHLSDYLKDKSYDVVEGNRISFVPKNWDIDRTIAIEPSWNVYFQLGLDTYLKKRLRRFGVYLKDQSRNHEAAREASLNGSLATVDMESASDCISTEAVRWFLPVRWFALFDQLRSKKYTLDKGKTWHTYDKFSSMGNGFTFPLESLIFYCVAKACSSICGEDVNELRVYGDDVIIHRSAYLLFIETVSFLGFRINKEKSFCFGPFRESCGRDYLSGYNVRPVYFRAQPRNVEDIYNLHNRLLLGSLVDLPSTLEYLRSCVSSAHHGPWFLPAGASSVDEMLNVPHGRLSRYPGDGEFLKLILDSSRSRWEPGGSQMVTAYFYVDPPDRPPRWSPEYQCHYYLTKSLLRRFKVDRHATDTPTRYLCFLQGIEGGIPLSTRDFRYYEKNLWVPSWPRISSVSGWRVKVRSS